MTRRTRPEDPPDFPGAETPAIGDHRNDLPGRRAAGLGVLRANPPPPLRAPDFPRAAARTQCGVARAPERFVFPEASPAGSGE